MNGALQRFPKTWNPALCEILLQHLRKAKANFWHGIDGLTLEDALNCYSAAAADGQVPSKEELLCQHPELAVELETFFTVSQSHSAKVLIDRSANMSTTANHVD
jgi:hypothetical protein